MKALLVLTLLFVLSCSHVSGRKIASENPVLDDIFTIRTSANPVFADNLKLKIETALKLNGNLEMIEDPELAGDKAFRVELEIKPDSKMMVTKVYYSNHSFQDQEAADALINFTRNITFSKSMQARYPYYEIYYNARHGHAPSLKTFVILKNARDVNFPNRSDSLYNSPGFQERLAADNKILPQLDAEIKKMKTNQKSLGNTRKILMDQLDKLPEDQQLKQVIARGDRKGAADLIRQYLPWELMAPFEKKYWEVQLEVMENPAPLEERVLIYRGLDDDFMHTAANLTKEQAVSESRAFYMSTVLVKNQGSWNRRLRSLETMYSKTIAELPEGKDFAHTVRVTSLFSNHAGDPVGSPFLSFSPDVNVARMFGNNKRAAFLIDPRLLSYNFVGIDNEAEFLMALTTFPEDMVHLIDRSTLKNYVANDNETTQKIFASKLAQRLDAEYGARGNEVYNKILKNSHNFFLNYFKPSTPGPFLPDVVPGPSNLKFYNGLKPGTVKPLLGPTGNLNCVDIVRQFW